MRILAMDTSTRRATVALVQDGRPLAACASEDFALHAERLIPLIDRCLYEAGAEKGSIELLACGVGPGSFTGVRVGLATAKGIALGMGIGLVGVGSLEAMARGLGDPTACVVVPILDARRGEMFFAAFAPSGEVLLPPAHASPGALVEAVARWGGEGAILIGEAASEITVDGFRTHRGPTTDLPDATTIARIAEERHAKGATTDLAQIEPAYVRAPDVRPPANLAPKPGPL